MLGKSNFCASLPTLQYAWDSTSLGTFKECPRKYYYQHILGVSPAGTSIHLVFGTAYHKALEVYDHIKAQGGDHEDGVHAAIKVAMSTGEYLEDVEGRPFRGIGEGPEPDKQKARFHLVRAVVWYLEQFKTDALETVVLQSGKPAVELSFTFELPDALTPDGNPYLLCGHLDRLVTYMDQYYFLDRKTTKSTIGSYYFDQFSPNNQMSLYYAATNVILHKVAKGGIIDAAQLLVGSARFHRDFMHRTPDQLEEWYADTNFWLRRAQDCAEVANERLDAGYFVDELAYAWPMNDKACGNYGGCPFQKVCSRSPKSRNIILQDKALFQPFDWNPLERRGDI